MVEGVNGSSAASAVDMKMTCGNREPDGSKIMQRHDPVTAPEIGDDNASLCGRQPECLLYSKPTRIRQFRDSDFPVLSGLVARILQDQYTASSIDNGELEATVMDRITPANAKTLVANEGHWRPDSTASRIISYALTISGNDPTKLEGIKKSIGGGFALARESFGGELPEISGRTFAAVIDGLEEWSKKQKTR
ncbi:MAG TPA: hypothetical protein VFG19_05835 [Geobacteraceae bacterium]|nr:hypothetical protein [Geobacteraceae bacterium]